MEEKGELRGLQWKDVNLERRTLSISKQITDQGETVTNFHFSVPKTKSSIRTLKMPKVLTDDFIKLKNEDKNIKGFNNDFFIAGASFLLSSNTLSNHKNENCKLAGFKQIRIHDFRLSRSSLLINKGDNVQVVYKYLGHTKIEETLNTYTRLFNAALNEVVNLIDELE